jgi:hypothetical protein
MMGTKARAFGPLCNLSLETLVPAGHFYREEEFPPETGRSCTRQTRAPCRAAATAAQEPASPPPQTTTSQASWRRAMGPFVPLTLITGLTRSTRSPGPSPPARRAPAAGARGGRPSHPWP